MAGLLCFEAICAYPRGLHIDTPAGIFLYWNISSCLSPSCWCNHVFAGHTLHSHSLVTYTDLFYYCLWTETNAKAKKFSTSCSSIKSKWSPESLEKWRFCGKKHKWSTEKGPWLKTAAEWNNCSCQGTDSDIDHLNSMYLQKDCAWGFMGGLFPSFYFAWDVAAWMEQPSVRKLLKLKR